ncbi:MAG: PLP-dependent transferase [Trueperaceae bacterium]|nr:PLP-dependent transferase [Trueperaceae bacterium]
MSYRFATPQTHAGYGLRKPITRGSTVPICPTTAYGLDDADHGARRVKLGDAESSFAQPASTTHSQLSEQQRHAAGVAPVPILVATGLAHGDDLRADCARALEAAQG